MYLVQSRVGTESLLRIGVIIKCVKGIEVNEKSLPQLRDRPSFEIPTPLVRLRVGYSFINISIMY